MRNHPRSSASPFHLLVVASTAIVLAACSNETAPTPLPEPNPPTANAYILPGAADLGANAFGDHPVVIRRGERLRWWNADAVEHDVTAETAALPEFRTTGPLRPGRDASFVMNTPGTTPIRCTVHPQMVGTLVVRE